MNPPKIDDYDYINYLIAAPRVFTCTEAARSQPSRPDPSDVPAHDSFNRLLERSFQDRDSLWREAKPLVRLRGGILVLDDTTLDKSFAKKIELVTRHWSGKHDDVVPGITSSPRSGWTGRGWSRATSASTTNPWTRRAPSEG